jgi:hypothetical protein
VNLMFLHAQWPNMCAVLLKVLAWLSSNVGLNRFFFVVKINFERNNQIEGSLNFF